MFSYAGATMPSVWRLYWRSNICTVLDSFMTRVLYSFSLLMQPVEGMLSHQLEQNRIDGEKTIIQVSISSIFPVVPPPRYLTIHLAFDLPTFCLSCVCSKLFGEINSENSDINFLFYILV